LAAVAVDAAGVGVAAFVLAAVAVVVTGVGAAVPALAFIAVAGAAAEVIRVELVVEPILEVVGPLRPVLVAGVDALSLSTNSAKSL
jgi:DNA-binding MltR family transcriptional regulator